MKTLKSKKAYRVRTGYIGEGNDWINHNSNVVVAEDAPSAIRKVRLRKDEYVSEVTIVATIDKV